MKGDHSHQLSHLVLVCELSLSAKFHACITLPSGRFWWGLLLLLVVVLMTGGKQSQHLLRPTEVQLVCKFRVEFDKNDPNENDLSNEDDLKNIEDLTNLDNLTK